MQNVLVPIFTAACAVGVGMFLFDAPTADRVMNVMVDEFGMNKMLLNIFGLVFFLIGLGMGMLHIGIRTSKWFTD